jgi:hypothetical protein
LLPMNCLNSQCKRQIYGRSLLRTNLGSSSRMLRWNVNLPNGIPTCHPESKSCGCQNIMRRSLWLCPLTCGASWICACRTDGNYCCLCQISELPEGCLAEKAGKMEKQFDPAPWKCAISYLPHSAAVFFFKEPNTTHPQATLILSLKIGLRGHCYCICRRD